MMQEMCESTLADSTRPNENRKHWFKIHFPVVDEIYLTSMAIASLVALNCALVDETSRAQYLGNKIFVVNAKSFCYLCHCSLIKQYLGSIQVMATY